MLHSIIYNAFGTQSAEQRRKEIQFLKTTQSSTQWPPHAITLEWVEYHICIYRPTDVTQLAPPPNHDHPLFCKTAVRSIRGAQQFDSWVALAHPTHWPPNARKNLCESLSNTFVCIFDSHSPCDRNTKIRRVWLRLRLYYYYRRGAHSSSGHSVSVFILTKCWRARFCLFFRKQFQSSGPNCGRNEVTASWTLPEMVTVVWSIEMHPLYNILWNCLTLCFQFS